MSDRIVEVDKDTFDDMVLGSDTTVLVDFWAPWCGPCRVVAPILEELASELDKKVRFVKVNTDEESEIAVRYGIRSIPTLKIFQDGNEVDEIVGFRSKADIKNKLSKFYS